MEKVKQYKYIILIVLVILGFAFYWYEWRPNRIYSYCNEQAKESARQNIESDIYKNYDYAYKTCLRSKGL